MAGPVGSEHGGAEIVLFAVSIDFGESLFNVLFPDRGAGDSAVHPDLHSIGSDDAEIAQCPAH